MADFVKDRIGLFGGTFDPIHFGHINLAVELFEKCRLKQIWFIPTFCSPFRSESIAGIDRLNMVRLAIEEIPEFQVSDIELQRDPPSYTIDTLREILNHNPEKKFALILGEDAAVQLEKWKDPEQLTALIPILIGCRERTNLTEKLASFDLSLQIREAIERGVVETSLMEISATTIRDRLKKRLYCGHLIPTKVLDYIYDNQLYFIP